MVRGKQPFSRKKLNIKRTPIVSTDVTLVCPDRKQTPALPTPAQSEEEEEEEEEKEKEEETDKNRGIKMKTN